MPVLEEDTRISLLSGDTVFVNGSPYQIQDELGRGASSIVYKAFAAVIRFIYRLHS